MWWNGASSWKDRAWVGRTTGQNQGYSKKRTKPRPYTVCTGCKHWIFNDRVTADNPNALRELGAQVIGNVGAGVVVLGANMGGKVSVVAFASKEAIASGHKAGDIVRNLTAQLDGKGGGRPDFAMGGGTNAEKLQSVVDSFSI